MKKISVLLIFTLVVTLFSSTFSTKTDAASVKMRPYLLLSSAVYESTKTSTLEQELLSLKNKCKFPIETYEIQQMRDWKKTGFADDSFFYFDNKKKQLHGFKASSYYNVKTNEIIVAYAGSKDLEDFKMDFLHYASSSGIQSIPAKNFAYKAIYNKSGVPSSKKNTVKISFTGHSLGGYLSQLGGVTIIDDAKYKKHVKLVVPFNALGIKEPKKLSKNPFFISPGYVSQSSWDNNFKYHKYDNYFVQYTIKDELADKLNKTTGMKKFGKYEITYSQSSSLLSFFYSLTPTGKLKKAYSSYDNHSIKKFYYYIKY